jgi:hypothetical protein
VVRSAIFVLAVSACSDLPPYQPECGNGVIDPHEDCDAKAGGCFACSLMCNFDGTTASGCPDGLACGGDGLCHAPGGAFRAQGPVLAFGAPDLFVTDLDRDRVGDVVGIGATSLSIHRGVLFQGPGPEMALQTPFVTGTPAVGHLDGNDPASTDTSLDVALPTADGFLAYSAPQGVLSPYPFALDVSGGNAILPYALMGLDGSHQALILPVGTQQAGFHLQFVEVDPITREPHLPGSPICSMTHPTTTLTVDVAQYDASSANTPEQIVALTIHDGTNTSGCAFAATLQGGEYVATDLLQLPSVTRLALAATLPGTLCPSAIDTDPSAPMSPFQEYRPIGAPGGCVLSQSPTPMTVVKDNNMIAADEVAVGGVRLSPGLPGYAVDALATTYGVYAIGANAPRLYRADRPIQDVRSIDLDGDGDLDVVATPAGLDDFDLLYRYQPVQGVAQSFQLNRYDTLAHASQVVLGDFDGNQIGDIAYTEKLAYGERLMVAYGTHDRPLAPIEMATFHSVVGMISGQLADTSDPSGTNVLDLGVLDHDDSGGTSRGLLMLLHGSPQRVMVPYFDPRPNTPLIGPSGRIVNAMMGRFGGSGDIADLFGIAALGPNLTAYLARAKDGAFALDETSAPATDGLVACARDGTNAAKLCAETAHYLTWPLPAGNDVILAVDDALPRHAVMFDPAAAQTITLAPQTMVTDKVVDQPLAQLAVHTLAKADVDGDGAPELIASFGASTQARQQSIAGMVVVCEVDATGTVTGCTDLETAVDTGPPDGPAVCVDAAAGVVSEYQRGGSGPVPPTELLVVCHRPNLRTTQVLRVAWDGSQYTSERVLDVPNTVERIFLGDVTGDAVADVLALDVAPGTLVPELRIYPQCTSRDTDAGCQAQAQAVPQ